MKLTRTIQEVHAYYCKMYPSFEKDLCGDWLMQHAEIHKLKNNILKRDEVDRLEMENDSVKLHPETMHHVDNIRIAQLAEQHAEIEKLKADMELQLIKRDMAETGAGFMKDGKRVPPEDVYDDGMSEPVFDEFEKLKAGEEETK